MKALLLFTALFAGCCSSKQQKLTSPTWQDGFIPNIKIDTLNSIMVDSLIFIISEDRMPNGNGLIYPIGRIDMLPDSTCKHPITKTTLAYCLDGRCNTVSCFSCGKILGKQ